MDDAIHKERESARARVTVSERESERERERRRNLLTVSDTRKARVCHTSMPGKRGCRVWAAQVIKKASAHERESVTISERESERRRDSHGKRDRYREDREREV